MPINDELSTLMAIKMEKRRFRSRSRSEKGADTQRPSQREEMCPWSLPHIATPPWRMIISSWSRLCSHVQSSTLTSQRRGNLRLVMRKNHQKSSLYSQMWLSKRKMKINRNQRKVTVRIPRINQTIHPVTTTPNLTNEQ